MAVRIGAEPRPGRSELIEEPGDASGRRKGRTGQKEFAQGPACQGGVQEQAVLLGAEGQGEARTRASAENPTSRGEGGCNFGHPPRPCRADHLSVGDGGRTASESGVPEHGAAPGPVAEGFDAHRVGEPSDGAHGFPNGGAPRSVREARQFGVVGESPHEMPPHLFDGVAELVTSLEIGRGQSQVGGWLQPDLAA